MEKIFLFKLTRQFKQNQKNILANSKLNKQTNLNILSFIFISLLLNSCVKEIEEIPWDIKNQPPMLVVDGSVTNLFTNQGIKLTQSDNYFSTDNPLPVHGASVSLSVGNNIYDFTESSENNGLYLSDDAFAGIPGETYELNIALNEAINGQNIYSSSSTMPQGLDIDSISCEVYDVPEYILNDGKEDTTVLVVYYFGDEPETVGNYYLANISRNDEALFPKVKEYPIVTDNERNGEYINFMATIKNVEADDIITFNLYSINKDYYEYINAISKIDETGNIYSPQGPPANALGNVEGALGYFIATYVSSGESIAKRDK